MSNEIIKVMDALCEKFGIAIEWTSENVTPYFQQLMEKFIKHEIAMSIFTMVMLVLATIIPLVIALVAKKKGETMEYFDQDEAMWWVMAIGFAIAMAAGIVALIVIGYEGCDIITCITFPEKKMIEYISSLKIL